jgi:transcriptional enhancer factor
MATGWHDSMLSQAQPGLESIGAHPGRVLQNTSGNIQYSDPIGHDDHLSHYAFKYPHHPPVLTHQMPTTASLHHPQVIANRIQAKKLRRLQSLGPSLIGPGPRRTRSYLKSQKYLEYRARPRRDTGKDGEAVWSDELEDAFQQGEATTANATAVMRKMF